MSGETVETMTEEVKTASEVREGNGEEEEIIEKIIEDQDVLLPDTVVPTMFGNINEANVTFCIDTSGSMYNSLDAVKRHLIDVLTKKAEDKDKETTFNIIEFNTEVTQWSDQMVKCSPETVAIAKDWVNSLKAKTGTNVLEALKAALSDDKCDAVYLVTDGYPDQHPMEILDVVGAIFHNRPVHCYYIHEGVMNEEALEFLKELALETYGSFHTITVAQNGVIERVHPVYSSEPSASRIIRTTSRNLYPANYKMTSLATTLDTPLDVHIEHPPVIIQSAYPAYYAPQIYHPFRYYYYLHPSYGWSRYRQSRSYMAEGLLNSPVTTLPYYAPGPGSLLIGTKVLARRMEDGHYYLGTVKSQILDHKFLIEFGPCKHGKFRQTSYQETHLYDIVSYTDGLRHSIRAGDKVLAPWQPEGECYGPGTVIDGQEQRDSKGSYEKGDVTVSFYNGKSATVSPGVTVWVPQELHERVRFELQLPRNVRQELSQEEDYPAESMPGYPTSGPIAQPKEYETFETVIMGPSDIGHHYYPPYLPAYPVVYKHTGKSRAKHSITREEMEKIIPGTEMTKDQLNEKVMSQIMEHKMFLEGAKREREIRKIKEDVKERVNEKLLTKRSDMGENTLKKSVTFEDSGKGSDFEVDEERSEHKDSGLDSEFLSDLELEDYDFTDEEDLGTRDVGTGTDSSLFRMRRIRSKRRGDNRPPWKYWKNNPVPSLIESNHYGPYRYGPFRDCLIAPPLENRIIQQDENNVVKWNNAMSTYADNMAVHRYEPTVKDSMGYFPRPPPEKPSKQGLGVEISIQMGEAQRQQDLAKENRRDFRRKHILSKKVEWAQNLGEKERQQKMMEDQHRARVMDQINLDRQRHNSEQEMIRNQREAKKAISEEIRQRIGEKQQWEAEREQRRVDSLRARREHREAINAQRHQEITDTKARRQAVREQLQRQHWEAHNRSRAEMDSQQAAREEQQRSAKVERIQHFRKLEHRGQVMREMRQLVNDNNQAVFRSTVLP